MTQEFLIVGGGIAGLATAAALQRRGHAVSVFEEKTDTSAGAGISIWPNALAALDDVGLGDAVRGSGGRVTAGAVRWRDGSWLRRPSADRMVRALGEPLVVTHRADLTRILSDALTDGTVQTGISVTGVRTSGSGVTVELSDGTSRKVAAVVGADGVGSRVARHLNGSLPHRYAGYTAWRGIARYRLDPELAGQTLGAGTEVGHVPLGSDHTYWFATERTPHGGSAPGRELDYLKRKYAEWAAPVPALLDATDASAVLRNDIYDRRQARVWSTGPITLVGDAAHPMRPHLGQGGCQGIEDAAVLARFVAGSPDIPTAFAHYAAFRRKRVRALVRESELIGRVVNLRPAVLGALAGRATILIPEALVGRHLGAIAARSAFVTPEAV
ncbi:MULTISPECIES: FAD-dependent oxidoreductase [Mycobacteriaceae]|uniref:FAD-dependent oxidoreductase n=1 Tax=Mycobacteriaceae TaxID=1762 RepID=UPI0007FE67AB|nr:MULTISPECIES: FAD-dependent oxidoreductase [Mycobacteriaceae]MCK0176724.1 FAD-dependent monooxygenase [Mycolicibacterium sp. F2034L]OBB56057.1 FAD-binding monooxygenase [Mycobacterium sp. 852013-51886_SCH5428379]